MFDVCVLIFFFIFFIHIYIKAVRESSSWSGGVRVLDIKGFHNANTM